MKTSVELVAYSLLRVTYRAHVHGSTNTRNAYMCACILYIN